MKKDYPNKAIQEPPASKELDEPALEVSELIEEAALMDEAERILEEMRRRPLR